MLKRLRVEDIQVLSDHGERLETRGQNICKCKGTRHGRFCPQYEKKIPHIIKNMQEKHNFREVRILYISWCGCILPRFGQVRTC